MAILRFFAEDYDENNLVQISTKLSLLNSSVNLIKIEKCYHVEISKISSLSHDKEEILRWLLKHPQKPDSLKTSSSFTQLHKGLIVIEIGPRFNFSTPFSTNCVNIFQNVGLTEVKRVEASTRYLLEIQNECKDLNDIVDVLSDKMTECVYTSTNLPIDSFEERLPKSQESWSIVPVLTEGRRAIENINEKLGLAFGEWDLEFYTNLFKNVIKRDPTTVEIFDCAQSNSEHSRHWFFRGKMIVNDKVQEKSLIEMIMETQKTSNQNNTIKFSDNSSAIKGFTRNTIRPNKFTGPGAVEVHSEETDLIFTAETHNMPTAVAPFSGSTTGTGGRIRDVQGVGRGGIPIAGTAGYCVGVLKIPGYELEYEDKSFEYPPSFADPLKVLIEASNGASDYGNKFGEPLITGFCISYGSKNAENNRIEYVKPIMFSGGLGVMSSKMTSKVDPKTGMLLAKIGGPVYRIGVGGGAASSVEVQGDNNSELDFNAVQRGDAEMENKLNRVVRACVEMGERNPILAIHDQGAGGNGNVLKELVEPGCAGAVIFSKEFQLGDPTINALELWGAEYQENNAILCKPEDRQLLVEICDRERCPISFVGIVTGNGYVTLLETEADFEKFKDRQEVENFPRRPFDLHLQHVLADMPKREYNLSLESNNLCELRFPNPIDFSQALKRVCSIVSVGSKRFLTNKVDRCVTGLIAQQQCVGPLHTPLADFGLVALSHFGFEGIATSIGTQPVKGILCSRAMARMTVAEALSNLVFVGITELADVKCSGNWMWAAKLPGEGLKLYNACYEMCQIMKELNIAIDGGKDSLSMAARVKQEVIKSPGTLVLSTYAPCPDIRIKITPDFKSPARGEEGELIWVNVEGKFRLGGSAISQAYSQQGRSCPNLTKSNILKAAFNVTQKLLKMNKLLSGHDISDGGLIICLLEMSFGGLAGLRVDVTDIIMKHEHDIDMDGLSKENLEIGLLFAEECGWVLEVHSNNLNEVLNEFEKFNIPAYHIGRSVGYGTQSIIEIYSAGKTLIKGSVLDLVKQWERTSFELEKKQVNLECAIQEYDSLQARVGPNYYCSFNPDSEIILTRSSVPIRVAVLREEGINSEREMMSSLLKANFEVHDVTMSDLLTTKTSLDNYRGVVFPGGFSYADTLGSAKGWAANIIFSDLLAPQFNSFKNRKDTFSLGICNGCQLMSLIGWIGGCKHGSNEEVPNVALLHNTSGRFECRWSTVKVPISKSILLKRMEGSVIGCWVAHGEGRFSFKDNILESLKLDKCIALQYVDDHGSPTEAYPMNPNGSKEGIAGLCSEDGRHLALMPHPERCSSMFQWPYVPPGFSYEKSPWQSMFDEAYNWCLQNAE